MGMTFAMIDSVLERERTTLAAPTSLEQFSELLPEAVLIRNGDERAWLNAYHESVRERVGRHVSGDAKSWLETRTRPL